MTYHQVAMDLNRNLFANFWWIHFSLPAYAELMFLQIAITGKSFCRSSAIATELIMNNILRIGRVNVIGDVILFLGKLCVSLSSAVFGFLMLDTHKYRDSHNKISSPLLPVLVCYLFSTIVIFFIGEGLTTYTCRTLLIDSYGSRLRSHSSSTSIWA